MKPETSEKILAIVLIVCALVGAITLGFFLSKLISLPWTIALVVGAAATFVKLTRHRRLPGDERPEGPRISEELAIEASDGTRAVMVPFGARLPVVVSETFSTYEDHQRSVEIRLVAGTEVRRVVTAVTHPIRQPGLRGEPQITVKLAINVRGEIRIEVTENRETLVAYYRGPSIGVATATPN